MDIGSNSIRLVIYDINDQGAYRVVCEHKDSARLSERMGPDQILHSKDILSIVPILNHYVMLCKVYAVTTVRAVATAAVRNAVNTAEIIRVLQEQTGLHIEVLSGFEEARYGYLGVINAMDIQDAHHYRYRRRKYRSILSERSEIAPQPLLLVRCREYHSPIHERCEFNGAGNV